ncbi:dihydrodipicolinate synthase family protein [Schaalia sp. ZJ1691]|uniref:dihydrodipicolinate synthase family protein n=1 Tax=Schaalia sp. ZJ1691 TaxID=2709404 RepID=UPI0013EDFC0A|nr:dihydrodipicolinate synthase family protein [Schaalia sp. ZJ1691]
MVKSEGIPNLSGLFAAIATPMNADESLDLDRLGALVDQYIADGVEGIYCCGSSGEGLLLSEDERVDMTRVVVDAAAGRVPVVAHVGALSTGEAIRLAHRSENCGVDALSMIPAVYYTYSREVIRDHYRAVMDATEIPMLIYNIPQFTGTEFTLENARELLDDPRIVGVKHTAHNMYSLERMVSSFPEKTFINGFDEVFLSAMAVGAQGSIGTTIGLQLPLFMAVRSLWNAGDVQAARRVQSQINEVIETLVAIDVFPAAKYLSGVRSIGNLGDCRRPFKPLSEEDRCRLDHLSERIDGWIDELAMIAV